MTQKNSEFIMVMDFFFSEIKGGAELNAESLVARFNDSGIPINKFKSEHITVEFLKNNHDKNFIFSNFILLKPECKQYAIDNLNYAIYEQDHKYLKTRNPIQFVNFIAPKDQLTNIEFYKNAKTVFFLTKLARDVFVDNTGLDNVCNLESSVWTVEDLAFIRSVSDTKKTKNVAVMNSNNPIKRRDRCIEYCQENNLDFELISDPNFQTFMKKLSEFEKIVFFTGHLETCARILVEAKMMNLKVICPKKLIGAASEPWFKLSGTELIDKMEEISKKMPATVVSYF